MTPQGQTSLVSAFRRQRELFLCSHHIDFASPLVHLLTSGPQHCAESTSHGMGNTFGSGD